MCPLKELNIYKLDQLVLWLNNLNIVVTDFDFLKEINRINWKKVFFKN